MFQKIREIHGKYIEEKIPRKGYRDSLKNKYRTESEEDYPIDFVVTWVDGNDPAWQQEKEKYSKDAGIEGNITARFREWGLFKYWFRMVERYAPWVNKVILVTYGHIPEWLNIDCPKLQIVKHSDYMPDEYLPTFSSVSIELNLWRIQDLSEHFVYFNDDTYLTKPVKPSDFFESGLPKYAAIAMPLMSYGMGTFQHELFANLGIINKHFNIREVISKNPEKWFSYVYGDDKKYNHLPYEESFLPGLWFNHLAVPYRKSTFKKVWNVIPERMEWTSKHKFRDAQDVMHQIFQLWDICEGNFIPVSRNYYGNAACSISEEAISAIESEKNIFVCLNDSEAISDEAFISLQKMCESRLEQIFNKKSMFEK